jgi:ABC-type nitrate/sulfonate/bicarbonate transport system permease component
MWNPHEPVTTRQRQVLGAVGVGGALAVWSAISLSGLVKPYFLPAPWDVAAAMVDMAKAEGDRNLFGAAWASARRVGLALLAVIGIGVPLGTLMGSSSKLNAVLSPLVDPMRSAPIVVLWFGIDETAKIVFLWLGASVFLIPMVRDAIVAVPRQHVVLAEDLGATPLEAIRHSVFPLALPRIVDAVIVAVGIEWTYITVAEFVNAKQGLGYLIQTNKRLSANDKVFAGILAILLLALVTDQVLKLAKRSLFPWEAEA